MSNMSQTDLSRDLNRWKRQELGQFLTPKPVAQFMASLFHSNWHELHLLDAGAGTGALSAALIKRLCDEGGKLEKISVTAYEVDPTLIDGLRQTYDLCKRECSQAGIKFSSQIFNEDFIKAAVSLVRGDFFVTPQTLYNAVIVNPPYRKINSASETRRLLRSAGIETTNLYSGFLALLIKLLCNNGELVAITPRSFCNGPYFKSFRKLFLDTMSLRRVHVFESRSAAFQEDEVLQENIIIHAVKSEQRPNAVMISTSSGKPDGEITERVHPYNDIVSPRDPDQFIHLMTNSSQDSMRQRVSSLSNSLGKVGLTVSTGRVVDFRAKEFLVDEPEDGAAPLVYPCHFNDGFISWPKTKSRKPNAIQINEKTKDLLIPSAVYVLVKRFSTKEEKRRVVACIYDPQRVYAQFVGFENHLNYFHANGAGMTMQLAKGLAAFLNSTLVDVYFRQFSGHTQVNATDLRSLNYPTRLQLAGC